MNIFESFSRVSRTESILVHFFLYVPRKKHLFLSGKNKQILKTCKIFIRETEKFTGCFNRSLGVKLVSTGQVCDTTWCWWTDRSWITCFLLTQGVNNCLIKICQWACSRSSWAFGYFCVMMSHCLILEKYILTNTGQILTGHKQTQQFSHRGCTYLCRDSAFLLKPHA